MASIISKKVNGGTYYYLREMGRVNGKPKMISERYLGKAEDVAAALDGAVDTPERTRHLCFGDLGAVWLMLERLDIVGIVDDVVGERRCDAGASVGTYLALIIANRVVAPTSKLGFVDWWSTTAGDRFVKVPQSSLDHRRFWDAMDVIDDADIIEIERRVMQRMINEFNVDISALVLDMTNFATFIDSANERNTIAQRGKAKQKRNDLRIVGLGLVVTRDGELPVVSHAYAGNRHDSTQFPVMIGELSSRYKSIAGAQSDISVVYDSGQNSAANQKVIEDAGLHFVGSVPPSDHPDLLAVPLRRYHVVDAERFPGLQAFESQAEVLGKTRRVIVTHSENFHQEQSRGLEQTIGETTKTLDAIAARLERGKVRKDRQGIEDEISCALSKRWMKRIFATTLDGDKSSELRLTYETDAIARRQLETELFGKRVLFTDQQDWSIDEVVTAYRSQSHVEAGFRQMKDPNVIGVSPIFHWTDSKIRVQLLCCVFALLIANLMRREARHHGIEVSAPKLLTELSRIGETVLIYPSTGGRPRARRMLTEMDSNQSRLYDIFGLEALAPRS